MLYFIYALTWPDSLKIILFGSIKHLKKIILKGRGFRGGLDEKMKRMWLGREIVVTSSPPSSMGDREQSSQLSFTDRLLNR